MSPERHKIFISYATVDYGRFNISQFVLALKSDFDVFYWEETASGSIIEYMEKYVRIADTCVFFCSKAAFNSSAVKKERDMAVYFGKNIIPIFTDIKWVPGIIITERGVLFQNSNQCASVVRELIIQKKKDLGINFQVRKIIRQRSKGYSRTYSEPIGKRRTKKQQSTMIQEIGQTIFDLRYIKSAGVLGSGQLKAADSHLVKLEKGILELPDLNKRILFLKSEMSSKKKIDTMIDLDFSRYRAYQKESKYVEKRITELTKILHSKNLREILDMPLRNESELHRLIKIVNEQMVKMGKNSPRRTRGVTDKQNHIINFF